MSNRVYDRVIVSTYVGKIRIDDELLRHRTLLVCGVRLGREAEAFDLLERVDGLVGTILAIAWLTLPESERFCSVNVAK